jgi:predicted short-subunit dehydrogenase-like oxidoreductase (DUF2520 family)
VSTTFSYAILGSGRLARHFRHYLDSLNLPAQLWARRADPLFNTYTDADNQARLERTVGSATHVVLAVKDEALAEVARQVGGGRRTLVHFSGAARVAGALSAHPLMTFGEQLESPEWYRRVPFVLDEGVRLADVLPGLPNPAFALSADERSYYHALCALAGNSTFLLLQQIGYEFERTLKLPRALLEPYLHQVVANASHRPATGFTGPVARGDWQIVQAHLDSLHRRPDLLQAYRQYLELAKHNGHSLPETLL